MFNKKEAKAAIKLMTKINTNLDKAYEALDNLEKVVNDVGFFIGTQFPDPEPHPEIGEKE